MITSSQTHAPADVASHYDELDYFYRDVWGEHVHHGLWITGRESRAQAVRQLAEVVAKEAELQPGAPVCDIGCGYGATARLLAREYGAQVTAMTVSPAQHAFATSLGREGSGTPKNPLYLLGDWLANTLPEQSFDAAIAIESSEHMPNLEAFFHQAHRVLKPAGRLVICAWLSCEHPGYFSREWLLEPICREGRMPHMGTESDYRALAEETGFSVRRFQDVSRQVASTWPRIAWTFLGKLFAHPRYLRFLLDPHAHNRIFALTIFRLWLAYRTGAMRYGVFTLVRN